MSAPASPQLAATPTAAPGVNRQPVAYAALVVASLLWGSMSPAVKPLVGVVGPFQLAAIRCGAAFVVLTLFCLLVAGPGPLRSALRRPVDVLVLSLVTFAGSSISTLMALQFISASLQVVITATSPVFLALLALAQGRMTARAAVGTVVALAGVGAVVGGDDPTAAFRGAVDFRGVGFALLSALIIACSQLWGRRTALRGDPLGSTALAAGASLPLMLALSFLAGGFGEVVAAPPAAKALVAYVGVFCTAVNFGLWFWALKHVPAARAAPIQYLSPPSGVLLAWLLLGEPLTVGLAIGTALVLGGVALTQSQPRLVGPSGRLLGGQPRVSR